jgi:hypothetical protein
VELSIGAKHRDIFLPIQFDVHRDEKEIETVDRFLKSAVVF